MNSTTHPLAERYLQRLQRCAVVLPRREREELLGEIRDHLQEGLGPDASEADVRNLLDQLGTPADIVDAAYPERPRARRGPREVFALVLLVTGLPPFIGWLIGVVLMLRSPLWTARQKLLGILVWPGGYVVLVLALSAASAAGTTCSVPPAGQFEPPSGCGSFGPSAWVFLAFALAALAPLLVATYLYRAAESR